jgi:hypothetical protein
MIDYLAQKLSERNCHYKPIMGTARGGNYFGMHYECYQVRGPEKEEAYLASCLVEKLPPTGDLHFITMASFVPAVRDGICLLRRVEDDGLITLAILVSVMHCPKQMHDANVETIETLRKQKAEMRTALQERLLEVGRLKKAKYETETAMIVAREETKVAGFEHAEAQESYGRKILEQQEKIETLESEKRGFIGIINEPLDHPDASQLGRSVRQLRRSRWRKLHVAAFCFAGSITAFHPLVGLIVLCQLWAVLYLCWAHSDRKRRRYEECVAQDQGITILTTRHIPTEKS